MIFGRKGEADKKLKQAETGQAEAGQAVSAGAVSDGPVSASPSSPAAPVQPAVPPSQPADATAPSPSPSPETSLPGVPGTAPEMTAEQKEQQARRAMGAKMVAASVGEIVSILMRSPVYKHFSLADLEWLVIPPVMGNQFSLAEARRGGQSIPVPIAVAFWASVSEEVDQKLSANFTGPLRLRPDEWKSGDILWLIDAVGPAEVLDNLVANLHKTVFKGRPLKIRHRGEDGKPVIKVQRLPVEE